MLNLCTFILFGIMTLASCGLRDNDLTEDQVELLKWDPPEFIKTHYVYYLSGYDNDGRPLWVAELGKFDIRKIIEAGGQTRKDFDKYVDQALLRFNVSVLESSTEERPVKEFAAIFDLDEYDMNQFTSVPTVQYVLQMAQRFDKSARRTLKVGHLVNANFLSETVYNLARPMLGETLTRMPIYGTNGARWKPTILKTISKSQLQKWYGGTAEPSDIKKVYG